MSRATTVLLVIGFAVLTALGGWSGRWAAAAGGCLALGAVAVLSGLILERSHYVATPIGLFWLALGLAGLVLLVWGWV